MRIDGEKFDFEMNMLMYTKQYNISVIEVVIESIYIEGNKSSHFNPIKDSIKIYLVFFKYILSSVISFILDISLYKIFFNIFINSFYTYAITISTVLARIISSLVNYIINKNVVFNKATRTSIIKYYLLCIIQMAVSALLVTFLYSKIHSFEITIKIIVDTIIFFINFKLQKEWVFKK